MFKNYLKIALRNVRRQKAYAFINIAGLAMGMACCILIVSFISTELSYDRFHKNANQIYRLGIDASLGGNQIFMPISNSPAPPTMVEDYPEVLAAVRIRPLGKVSIKDRDLEFYEENALYVDKSIFEVFTFPMIKGDPQTALSTAYSMVMTEDTAEKYFGEKDPIGKILKVDNQFDFTVTGIVENVPKNSHFTFDILCSFETLYARNRQLMEVWLNFNLYTYLLLPEGVDLQELENKFPALIDKHMGPALKAIGGEIEFFLQPITRIHLHSHMENEISANSHVAYVYIFSSIALFILFIACINFMNLATARSTIRAKEVGIRKVVGAERRELIRQFLGESLIYSLFSLLLAILLAHLTLPLFSSLSGRELSIDYFGMPWLIPGLIVMVLVVGFAAGSYPALFLSSFHPARVIKGSLRAGATNSRFRSILVVGQFVISISLIIATGIILNQLRFMKNKDLGFDQKNIIVVRTSEGDARESIDSIKEEFKRIPGVMSAGLTSQVPGREANVSPFVPEGFSATEAQLMKNIAVDQDFIPTMGIKIIAGRNFSKEFGTDVANAIIINETAAEKFGWDNPIGKKIEDFSGEEIEDRSARTVVGVIKDIHMSSLHSLIMPLHIRNESDNLDLITLRLNPGNVGGTLDLLRNKWRELYPNQSFDYYFFDDSWQSLYESEDRLSRIFSSFTIFAIFIASLGLFGMASFTAEQRTKEIGIRKVLGASVTGVVVLLAKDFLKLVILANVIAWPVAYFALRKWMQSFAYQEGVGIWVFVLTAILAIGIALLTVSFQSIKAAVSNPIDAIKYE
jgi:putative ABC transport system permease protein